MLHIIRLIVVLLSVISHEYEATATYVYVNPYTSRVAPIRKHTDAAKPLYSVQIMTSWVDGHFLYDNFIIDTDAPLMWHDCVLDSDTGTSPSPYPYPEHCPTCRAPVSCEEYQCTEVQTSYSHESASCVPVTNSSTLPGSGFCTCPVNVVNPVHGQCGQALLNYDTSTLNTSDGRNPFQDFFGSDHNAACAPLSMLELFPENVSGVIAISRSRYALPSYLHNIPYWRNVLALCLPSSLSARGTIFFGNGPYYFLPESDVDVRSLLSYTPLLTHPDSFGYYIGVEAIVIKGRSIDVGSRNITTKLSTTEPYTTLRSDIYKSVVRRFSKVTKRIPIANPVAPFGLCFREVNVKVPDIVFSLQDGSKWSVSTANSIKQITKDVGCLAFVEGGETSDPAIVIGAFQFEDNFIMFNFENSTLGFSSSLLKKGTSCANFNFTTGGGQYI